MVEKQQGNGGGLEKTKDTMEMMHAGHDDTVLVYAWELYETYSGGSQQQKQANSGLRQQVIWLIFWTSVLAVVTTLPGVRGLLAWLASFLRQNPNIPYGNVYVEFGNVMLSATLIILSVATSALLAFAGQFTPLKAWIMYRAGADRIRSEIYLYRMVAGAYEDMQPGSAEIRAKFLKRIERINREIYQLETAPPFLQLMAEKDGTYNHSTPRIWWNRLWRFVFFRWRTNTSGKGTVRAITPRQDQRVAQGEKKRLSGRYYPEYDDGFNDLTVEDYIEYRVMPQRNWYVEKVYEDYEKIKDWRKVTLTIGGLSAVLAAIRLEPYIVITTAAAVGVNTHIQLNLIGSTHGNYHVTASRIDNELVRWRNLPLDKRQDPMVISNLVTNIEAILEAERVVWMQQASQAQQETEQTLVKGASKREGMPSLLEKSNINTPTLPDLSSTEDRALAYVRGESMMVNPIAAQAMNREGDEPEGEQNAEGSAPTGIVDQPGKFKQPK